MATEWKSQQGDGKYCLQFETDNKERYLLVEKAAQMAVDGKGADVVEVTRCKDCQHCKAMGNGTTMVCLKQTAYKKPNDFCSGGKGR
jgi:MinD superfamily P-loop ATPase